MPRGACEPPVASEQGALKRLCKGDVCGVVKRQVLTQLPATAEQVDVASPLQWDRREIVQRKLCAAGVDLSGEVLAPKDRADFEVDQLGSRETLPSQSSPSPITVRAVVGEGHNQHAGINDDHGPPAQQRQQPSWSQILRSDHRPGSGLPRGSAGLPLR
jgi:hypothetical protein